MHSRNDHRYLKGAIAGAVGGLIASWVMNQFQSGVSKVEKAWENSAHRPQAPGSSSSSEEPATAKLARRIARTVLGRELRDDEIKIAGPLVHYGYGTLAGGLYGLMAEVSPAATKGTGSAYATALWLFGDEIAVPKLGLSKPPSNQPAKVHAKALAAHMVYGVASEEVRRGVRAIL
jgi:hypothetical protein